MDYVPYASAVGGMMYGIVYTRLDITQVTRVFSLLMANFRCEHWVAIKRVFRYL